jgi:two-component system phosphate regulon response regulator PhoB/two-component system alkaline phosphatase synthesis response regulator PhoP/two-component system response regulator VicR
MTKQHEILVVDDDRDIRDSLKIILEKNGYTVRLAGNGKDALQKLVEQKPDLMILDVMMSTDTEGFDLAYELKNMPDFENLPIIILTSFMDKVRNEGPDQFQHIMGEAWPAKWLFEKPIDSDRLIKKIAGILQTP